MGADKRRDSCSSCKGQSWQDSGKPIQFPAPNSGNFPSNFLISGTSTPPFTSWYSPSQWPAGLLTIISITLSISMLETRQRQKRRERKKTKESCISQMYFSTVFLNCVFLNCIYQLCIFRLDPQCWKADSDRRGERRR